jgi:hypothetical protein
MALADDLVEAAAREISEVDGHASSVEPCGDATYPQMARVAAEAALRELKRHGYRYVVSGRMEGPRRRDLRALADEVERGGRGE